jgi:hypothetical protein
MGAWAGFSPTRRPGSFETSRAHQSLARDTARAMSEENLEQLHRAYAEWAR